MLKEITREDGTFEKTEHGFVNKYFCGVHKGEIYAWAHIQYLEMTAYIHLKVDKFTGETLKAMKIDLLEMKKKLAREKMLTIMGALAYDKAESLRRLTSLLGFSERTVQLGGNEYSVMELEV